MLYTAGNHGEGIRSDCFISLEISSREGIQIDLKSKVNSLYEKSIIDLCTDILNKNDIKNARLEIDDSGALPFVIAARTEAAIRKYTPAASEYLLPQSERLLYKTERERDRITRLYLPGNHPKLMINAGIYHSDGIILDLEDSVSPEKKDEARLLVRNALRSVDFYGAEKMVRINQVPAGLDDLNYCVPHSVQVILIPKCEHPDQVLQVDQKIAEILGEQNTSVFLMPIVESAKGIINAFGIASASPQIVAMAIGLEDYTADIGMSRTNEGRETLYARSAVVNACVAAGIQPIDSVFSEIENMDALSSAAAESKLMGFRGMGCIHPRQITVIREQFLPTENEIQKARKIVVAWDDAQQKGSSVVAVDSKMIDPPVVKRALRTIQVAVKSGKLAANWKECHE